MKCTVTAIDASGLLQVYHLDDRLHESPHYNKHQDVYWIQNDRTRWRAVNQPDPHLGYLI